MKNHFSVFLLILLLFFGASCNGQVKTNLPADSLTESKTVPAGQSKLIKTQGSGEYANVSDAIQDKAGNLWFATTGEGVYRYDGENFVQFTEADGLGSNYVFCIIEDRSGNIWFGTADGTCYYDGKVFTHIPITAIKKNYASYQKTAPDIYGVPGPYENYVWSMLQDKSGTIWLGTFDGMYRYDGKTFTEFFQNNGIMGNTGTQLKGIESMLEDSAGNIWFGGRVTAGAYRYDGKEIINLKANDRDWLMPVLADTKGNIWFWGSGLPCMYDGKTFIYFPRETFPDGVYEVAEDLDGNIWIGHLGAGVYRYDGTDFRYFDAKDGFDKKGVSCILADKQGNIWFGTQNMGLIKYDGKVFTNLSE